MLLSLHLLFMQLLPTACCKEVTFVSIDYLFLKSPLHDFTFSPKAEKVLGIKSGFRTPEIEKRLTYLPKSLDTYAMGVY